MSRLLPPLLVLLTLALVAVRCAMEPSRAEARARISGMVQGGAFTDAGALLDEYLERFDERDDIWFAAREWFRMKRPLDAIDVVWKNPGIVADPETSKRFAEAALFALGWNDEERSVPTIFEPHALIVLVEGGNAWAEARLRKHASTLALRDTTPYFYPAVRGANRRPLDLMVEAYRKREDKRFLVAAAFSSIGPEPYPERDADRDRLIRLLGDDTQRRQHEDVWGVSAFALGRLGDEPSVAALRKAAGALKDSNTVRDGHDRLLALAGLVAAGDFSGNEEVAADALGERPNTMLLVWYLESLLHRYQLGDARTEPWLKRIWEGPAAIFSDLRIRMARALLLTDQGRADAVKTAKGIQIMTTLESPTAKLPEKVMAAAARLERGDPKAREKLVSLLREAAAQTTDKTATGLPPEITPPVIEALRSLYLYG